MKTYEEMAQNALLRGNAIRQQRKKNQKILIGVLSALAVFCLVLLIATYSPKYQRISFNQEVLGEELASHINAETMVKNTASANIPSKLPIYKIIEEDISAKEFYEMQQQLKLPQSTSSWHGLEWQGNKIDGYFADFGTGEFTMSDKELEVLARETFQKLSFMKGDYEYSGVRGRDTLSSSKGTITTRVLVSFYRILDDVRVVGNDRCDMWFNDSGLVEIHIERYNYKKIGTMDMVSLEDAVARIKTPDDFFIDASIGVAEVLQVDSVKLRLVNQYSKGCIILQPIYYFTGTATMNNGKQAEFSSKIIAIPESYTYEKE